MFVRTCWFESSTGHKLRKGFLVVFMAKGFLAESLLFLPIGPKKNRRLMTSVSKSYTARGLKCTLLKNQHGIAIAKESVLFLYCFLIHLLHEVVIAVGAGHHIQG